MARTNLKYRSTYILFPYLGFEQLITCFLIFQFAECQSNTSNKKKAKTLGMSGSTFLQILYTIWIKRVYLERLTPKILQKGKNESSTK